MAFLRVNGYVIPVLVDDVAQSDDTVESWVRAANDDYVGTTYSRKQSYDFHVPPVSRLDALAIDGWVRGRGHVWTFQRSDGSTTRFTRTSDEAGLTFSTGTSTASSLFGAWGLQIPSAATAFTTTSFGSDGDWTVQAHLRSSGNYASYVVRSIGGTVDYWVAGATVPGPFSLNDPIAVTAASGSLLVSLNGRIASGNATMHFGAVRALPYALNEGQILSLASVFVGVPTTGWARHPYVTVTGSFLNEGGPAVNAAGERGGRPHKGFTSGSPPIPRVLSGTFHPDARDVAVRLVQR
jgi:hypothetical protein